MDLGALLTRKNACGEALEWLADRPTTAATWLACERGDWLLWLCGKIAVDRRYLVAATCACAQGTLHLVPAGDDRPRRAVATAILWTQGQATIDEVRAAAADAAYAYAYAAAYAASAAYAYAADAAYAAAYGADDAADAAYAAAVRPGTLRSVRRQTAARVRAVIPWRLVAARLRAHGVEVRP